MQNFTIDIAPRLRLSEECLIDLIDQAVRGLEFLPLFRPKLFYSVIAHGK